jgi:hypothetical protein
MNKLYNKTLKDLLAKLNKQAQELIDWGNSKEKTEGYGMQKVIIDIDEYIKPNKMKKSELQKLQKISSTLEESVKLLKEIAKPNEPKEGDFVYNECGDYKYIDIIGENNSSIISFNLTCKTMVRVLIPLSECDNVRPATEEEKQILLDTLHTDGKDWDFENKKLVNYFPRAKKGGEYWCVGGAGDDCSHKDYRDAFDNYRYETGNYSLTREGLKEYREFLKTYKK